MTDITHAILLREALSTTRMSHQGAAMADTNYAVPPGEYVKEWLEENNITLDELTFALGVTETYANELITGKVPVSAEIATALERLTGIPMKQWVALDLRYWTDRHRIRREENMTVVSREVDEENDLIIEVLEERGGRIKLGEGPFEEDDWPASTIADER